MKFKRYKEEDLKDAIFSSITIREILLKLKIKPCGGNYFTINKYIKENNINIDHLKGKIFNKGKKLPHKRNIEEYLSNKFYIQSYKLKQRLLQENLIEEKCYSCGFTTWLGGKIPLELDHINGDKLDNSLENLRLLCPNCHALTPTYRGKKLKK